MKVNKSFWRREFKGLREFNCKGLKAILMELALNLDYESINNIDEIRLIIKALINQSPNYYASWAYNRIELENQVRFRKPNNMVWRDFETYSRLDFDDFEVNIE